MTDDASAPITNWSPLIVQALLGEQPTTMRTVAPDVSAGSVIVFAPRCKPGDCHPPSGRAVFGDAACAAGREASLDAGRGAAAGRVTRAAGRDGVATDGFAFGAACIAWVEIVDGAGPEADADAVADAIAVGVSVGVALGAATADVDGVGSIDTVGNFEVVGMVTAASPTSLSPVGLEVVAGAALLPVGANVVTAPKASPPRTQAPRARARVRGVRSITHSPRPRRSPPVAGRGRRPIGGSRPAGCR